MENDTSKIVKNGDIKEEDVVLHSINNNSNIIATSFDECDEYNQISFKVGKPIRSPILLSTLINSKNILGAKKHRSVTIKNVVDILKEVSKYFNGNIGIKPRKTETKHFETVLSKALSNNSNYIEGIVSSIKDELKTSSKEEFKTIISELVNFYEQENSRTSDALERLISKKLVVIDEYGQIVSTNNEHLIIAINEELFIYINKNDPMLGTLCSIDGLMIILNSIIP